MWGKLSPLVPLTRGTGRAGAHLTQPVALGGHVCPQLDQRQDGDSIQDALLEVTGGRSVPRVFIGGAFIGGGDDTVRESALSLATRPATPAWLLLCSPGLVVVVVVAVLHAFSQSGVFGVQQKRSERRGVHRAA